MSSAPMYIATAIITIASTMQVLFIMHLLVSVPLHALGVLPLVVRLGVHTLASERRLPCYIQAQIGSGLASWPNPTRPR